MAPEDEQTLRAAAELINARAKEIRGDSRLLTTERIAVSAALQIAFDSLRGNIGNIPADPATLTRVATLRTKPWIRRLAINPIRLLFQKAIFSNSSVGKPHAGCRLSAQLQKPFRGLFCGHESSVCSVADKVLRMRQVCNGPCFVNRDSVATDRIRKAQGKAIFCPIDIASLKGSSRLLEDKFT